MLLVFRYILAKNVIAMTLWPFIFLRDQNLKENQRLLNHEKIHLRQQIELLVIFFYLWYGIEFLIHIVRYRSYNKAYKKISFEKEAYTNDQNLNYLKERTLWSFLNYM